MVDTGDFKKLVAGLKSQSFVIADAAVASANIGDDK